MVEMRKRDETRHEESFVRYRVGKACCIRVLEKPDGSIGLGVAS